MKSPQSYSELIRDTACQNVYVYSVGAGRTIIEEAMLDGWKQGFTLATQIIRDHRNASPPEPGLSLLVNILAHLKSCNDNVTIDTIRRAFVDTATPTTT